MDIELKNKLNTDYPIELVTRIESLDKGNTSEAKLIETTNNRYILRKMRDEKQSYTEYAISGKLAPMNSAPRVILTKHSESYFEFKGDLYNLQTYIPHENKRNQDVNYFELSKTVSLFHKEMKSITGIHEQGDRFSLDKMAEGLTENILYQKLPFHTEIIQLIEKSINYTHVQNTYIHGDLGKWNILFKGDKSYIIDYGEVRKGNNHFDIAAVLDSTIDWKRTDEEILKAFDDFKRGYLMHFKQFNWSTLKEAISLWTVRGIVAMFINHGINDETENYVEATLKKLERINRLLTHG